MYLQNVQDFIRIILTITIFVGICKHENLFEGSTDVRQVKFHGDVLALAMTDGRICLVDMNSGDIVDRFHAHDKGK